MQKAVLFVLHVTGDDTKFILNWICLPLMDEPGHGLRAACIAQLNQRIATLHHPFYQIGDTIQAT